MGVIGVPAEWCPRIGILSQNPELNAPGERDREEIDKKRLHWDSILIRRIFEFECTYTLKLRVDVVCEECIIKSYIDFLYLLTIVVLFLC